jgi:hypothetical protein
MEMLKDGHSLCSDHCAAVLVRSADGLGVVGAAAARGYGAHVPALGIPHLEQA